MKKRGIRICKILLIFVLLLSVVAADNSLWVQAGNETKAVSTEGEIDAYEQGAAEDAENISVLQENVSGQISSISDLGIAEDTEADVHVEETESQVSAEDEQLSGTIGAAEADVQTEETESQVSAEDEQLSGTIGAAEANVQTEETESQVSVEDVSEPVTNSENEDGLHNIRQGLIAVSDNSSGTVSYDTVEGEMDESDTVIIIPDENEGTLLYESKDAASPDGWGEIIEEDQLLLASYSSIPKGIWLSGMKEATYTGEEITFDTLRVYDENIMLLEGRDYEVSYQNNW